MKFKDVTYPKLSTFTERLNYAFDNSSMSQTAVAKEILITQPSFNNLLSGKTKSTKKETAEKIAEVLGVDVQWLITGIVHKDTLLTNLIEIPLVDGFQNYFNTQSKVLIKKPSPIMQLDIKALKNRNINFEDARYIPMPDKGMGITINEDSPVFFDKSNLLIEDGRTYVIEHGGMIQVRLLFNTPMGGIKVQAIDPRFESFNLDINQQNEQLFKVLGLVFAVINFY